MPVQWSIERLKPWTDTAEEKFRSWMRASQTLNWRPEFSLDFSKESEWTLERVQERFNDLQDNVKAKVGIQIFNRTAALARQLLGAEMREVEISDGSISYWQTNHANAKDTVLFIHGFGDSKDGCYHLAMHLIPHYNMIALDLPGFGSSFKHPHLKYDNESYGRWLAEFLDKVGSGPVHVVGNSLGGAMAIKAGLVRPDLVKSLMLLDPAFISDFKSASVYDEFLSGKIIFQIKNRVDFSHLWSRGFFKEPMLPVFVKDYIYEQFRDNHDWYGHFFEKTFGGVRSIRGQKFRKLFLNDDLPNLKVPTFIVWGEHDSLFPVAFGEKAHKLIPNSKFHVMKGIGHAPQVETPRQTAKLLKKWILELKESQAN